MREDDPDLVLDGLDAKAAIGVTARQHDTNRVVLIFDGERPEQRINWKVVLECGSLSQMKASIGHRERRIRRDDIDVIGLNELPFERQTDRHFRCPRKDFGQEAFVMRIEMLDEDPRDACSGVKGAEQFADGFETAGPAVANFLFVRVGDAEALNDALLRRGVIVRPMGAFGAPDALRITAGTREEIGVLADALAALAPVR